MIQLRVTCPYCHKTRPATDYYALPRSGWRTENGEELPDLLVLRCGCGGTFASTRVLPVVKMEDDAA